MYNASWVCMSSSCSVCSLLQIIQIVDHTLCFPALCGFNIGLDYYSLTWLFHCYQKYLLWLCTSVIPFSRKNFPLNHCIISLSQRISSGIDSKSVPLKLWSTSAELYTLSSWPARRLSIEIENKLLKYWRQFVKEILWLLNLVIFFFKWSLYFTLFYFIFLNVDFYTILQKYISMENLKGNKMKETKLWPFTVIVWEAPLQRDRKYYGILFT